MKKKGFLFLILSIFLIGIISAEVSYCCERLGNEGPWCQNAPQEECGDEYRSVPTSCESTSYCKLGTCINTKEGLCMPNTPQKVCENNDGVWNEKDKDEISQCQLGCCLIGDQAAFTTLTRCKQLSSNYGLEINYRTDIQNERECIANARTSVKGACVFEKEYEKTCKMLTREECQEMQTTSTSSGILDLFGGEETTEEVSVEFHEGYLCSAESLETICGPSKKTTCVDGKDEVYFLDTCGNLANIYDASKVNELSYWEKITDPDCGDGEGNKDSKTCGSCDYFLGSTCKEGNANYGNYMCKDLKCEYEGDTYQHGETWCSKTTDNEKINSPGGRHIRLICYNGEVISEPCADYRQEVCIQSSVGDFKTAGCRVNMWQDCYSQENQKDCENLDKRDCKWVEGFSILGGNETKDYFTGEEEKEYSCVPKYAPGFDFWEEETDAESLCSLANDVCIVEYYAGTWEGALTNAIGIGGNKNGSNIKWELAGDPKCMADCKEGQGIFEKIMGEYTSEASCATECIKYSCVDENGELREEWKKARQDVCTALGDCGVKNNYLGKNGYFDNWEESFVREDAEEVSESDSNGGLFGLFG